MSQQLYLPVLTKTNLRSRMPDLPKHLCLRNGHHATRDVVTIIAQTCLLTWFVCLIFSAWSCKLNMIPDVWQVCSFVRRIMVVCKRLVLPNVDEYTDSEDTVEAETMLILMHEHIV